MPNDRQKEKIEKRGRGSILVGIILIFILISSISIAIIGRAKHGAQLAIDSKKGYSAYQDSDSSTEKILNSIKKLDSDNLRIPESTPASAVCDGICYEKNKVNLASKVADVFFIKKEGEAQNLERAIFAPVPDRLENPVSAIAVNPLCEVSLTLPVGLTCDKISQFEVRSSSSHSLDRNNWKKVGEVDCTDSVIAGGSIAVSISGVVAGDNLTAKAKNKSPFMLDSLYFLPSPLVNVPSGC